MWEQGPNIILGEILKAHGIRGWLRFRSYAHDLEVLKDLKSVIVQSRDGRALPAILESVRPFKGSYLLKFGHINTREEAEGLKGAYVLVPKGSLNREPGEYFWSEIIGMKVMDLTNTGLGTVASIIPTNGHDIYVVKGEKGEILVPAVEGIIKEVSLREGFLIVDLPKGLIGLNEV